MRHLPICVLLLSAAPALAQHQHGDSHTGASDVSRLGRVEFANSGAAAAQPAFQRGMALLHSFLSSEAAEAFREAQRIDSRFAMAYWGEARADRDNAAAILERMAPTPEARLGMAGTERERAYLRLMERLSRMERFDAVETAVAGWREVHAAYPEDDDATLFLAWALVDQRYHAGDDAAASLRLSTEAAELAESVFRRRPDHPGAAHYLIHATDDSRLARRGLRAAEVYADIAPVAHHAVHMPSHIFFQLGRWEDVVRSNQRAWALSRSTTGGAPLPPERWDYHAAEWLHYGLVQQGRIAAADALVDSIEAAAGSDGGWLSHQVREMRARADLEARRYTSRVPEGERPPDSELLLAGVSAAVLRDPALAERTVEIAERLTDFIHRQGGGAARPNPLFLRQAHALRMAAAGDPAGAAARLREAADAAESSAVIFLAEGPQRAATGTTRLLLGEMLLAAGQPAEALRAFDRALELSPGRSAALLGRARALSALGRGGEAGAAYAALAANWRSADPGLPGVEESRRLSRP